MNRLSLHLVIAFLCLSPSTAWAQSANQNKEPPGDGYYWSPVIENMRCPVAATPNPPACPGTPDLTAGQVIDRITEGAKDAGDALQGGMNWVGDNFSCAIYSGGLTQSECVEGKDQLRDPPQTNSSNSDNMDFMGQTGASDVSGTPTARPDMTDSGYYQDEVGTRDPAPDRGNYPGQNSNYEQVYRPPQMFFCQTADCARIGGRNCIDQKQGQSYCTFYGDYVWRLRGYSQRRRY